jgi:pimeloyl-ACP methyl ester carboxylesterase
MLITEEKVAVASTNLQVKRWYIDASSDKPTIIFLHDALGSIAQWRDFPESLAILCGLNCMAYDRCGYGLSSDCEDNNAELEFRSTVRPNDYLHQEADILEALLLKLGIRQSIIFGHSDGATIALLYAAKYNPRAIISEAAHAFVEDLTHEGILKTLENTVEIKEKLKKYHKNKAETIFNAWHQTWLSTTFKVWNIENEITQITCPVCIIQGKNDEYGTIEQVNKIENAVKGFCEINMVEDCGHFPHIEKRDAVLNMVQDFITKNL